MASGEEKLADLVRHIVTVLEPKIAVRLWNGEWLGPTTGGPVLALNDPAAIARLAVSPNIATAVGLWMSKAIDVEHGTIFDLAAARPDIRTKAAMKRIDKLKVAASLPALYGLSRRAKTKGPASGEDAAASGSSKAAIQFHYDVSNDFYRLFLDSRMLYSCGYFDGWHDDIDKAQVDKLDMICRKLRLKPGERFLDIGCGWGALLIHAAENYGVTGHGVTLSQAQFDLAKERIAAKGLADKVTVELKPF